MRLTDLELYRWKWHNEVYLQFKRVQAARRSLPLLSYWKEYGAFISMLPRQVGKTTMLGEIAKKLSEESFIQIVVPTEKMAQNFSVKTGLGTNYVCTINTWLSRLSLQLSTEYAHLIVDEFNFIEKNKLDALLDRKWTSVSMASTLK